MSHTLQYMIYCISKGKYSNLYLSDDHGPDENSESETVSIKNIQFLTEAENTGLLIFGFEIKLWKWARLFLNI